MTYENKTCLFIGHFQPFHTGHLMVVEGMAKSSGRVIIAVGSSNKSDTKENPFSWDERREMIQRALQEKDLIPRFDVSIVAVDDVKDDSKWMDEVKKCCGEFDVVWTGNKETKKFAEAAGYEVKDIKEVPGISAAAIREMMRDDNAFWDEKVPESVKTYIKSIEGHERVRNLG
ncbi:MAG: nicotinamide-nucleotide adenylyltransferase [bacterium]|nr:nicotinamide-nucleotide adenylyltransferase [bacterium]